jgi:putative addiction module CopG family antidote
MIDMSNVAKEIALPEELQAFAEERVRSGEYASVSEVVQEAFRLLQQRDKVRKQAREDLIAVFREMEDGNHLEPSDDEFEQAVQARAPTDSAE